MRVSKEHEERRGEILDAAGRLFAVKGYGKCTINDILQEVGIAKGTFYYYFKSKEEVLDAMLERVTDMIEQRVRAVLAQELPPELKLLQAFMVMRVEEEMDQGILEELHKPENALMHQKSLCMSVERLTPILAGIVQEENEQGRFHSRYPEQYMQIFMAASLTLLDGGIFPMEPEKQMQILQALIDLMGKILGIDEQEILKLAAPYLQQMK